MNKDNFPYINPYKNKVLLSDDKSNKGKHKSYFNHFIKRYKQNLNDTRKKYYVIINGINGLFIENILPEDCEFKKLIFELKFTDVDNVITKISTDDKTFKESLFNKEVIETNRCNEAWCIIKERYSSSMWIEKYIYFLLNAPNNVIELIE